MTIGALTLPNSNCPRGGPQGRCLLRVVSQESQDTPFRIASSQAARLASAKLDRELLGLARLAAIVQTWTCRSLIEKQTPKGLELSVSCAISGVEVGKLK
jgi:hypothetical protein